MTVSRNVADKTRLEEARALLGAAKYWEAEQVLKRLYVQYPCNLEVLHLLGRLAIAQDNKTKAMEYFRKAVDVEPQNPVLHHNLAISLFDNGRTQESIQSHRRAIELRPDYYQSWNTLGTVYQSLGRIDEARMSFQKAVDANPKYALALNNLGMICFEEKNMPEAAKYFREALKIDKEYPEALCNFARILVIEHRYEEAERMLEHALNGRPDFPQALLLKATIAHENGRLQEARELYSHVHRLNPKMIQALYSLGLISMELERYDDAIRYFQQVITAKPHHVDALKNIAYIYSTRSQDQEAQKFYSIAASHMTGNTLLKLAQESVCPPLFLDDYAMEEWRTTLIEKLHNHKPILLDDYADMELYQAFPSPNLLQQGRNDLAIRKKYASILKTRDTGGLTMPIANERPHIGVIVSSHEAVEHFVRTLAHGLGQIDPEKFQITVACPISALVSLEPLLGESVRVIGLGMGVQSAVSLLREQAFHVAWFFDVGATPSSYYLPYFRIARAQCGSWNSGTTSGIPTMDYYLSSRYIEPQGASEHYSESLLQSDTLPFYTPYPKNPNKVMERRDFGLPEKKNLYLCLQSIGKISIEFDAIIEGILNEDRDAMICLIDNYSSRYVREQLLDRLKVRLDETQLDRLLFLPNPKPDDRENLIALADAVLDTPCYDTGSVLLEAFAVNTPVITMPSDLMRSRFALGCYRVMEIDSLIARDADDYIKKALQCVKEPSFQKSIRKRIAERSEILFENQDFVRELEGLLTRMLAG